ncbi:PREDICTED: titin-like [Priapulus caudatus]|uniref:Titin-like n=1 Tax=Priapulus caudatus TaxID=37621 RepID=A0ABM1E669_PRICU|nr:PREDICTED: titin-like [Priapulus caudatus]
MIADEVSYIFLPLVLGCAAFFYAYIIQLTMPAPLVSGEDSGATQDEEEKENEAPQFVIRPRTTMVELGKTARFQCSVSGTPKLSVAWDIDGSTIRNGGRFRVFNDDINSHFLEISNVAKSDLGTYTCTCSNSVGTVTAFAALQLAGDIGEKVEFHRQASSHLEAPEFVQHLQDMEVTEHSDVKLTVRVREVFDEDKCAPVFLEKPKPWSGTEGSPVRFSCKVDGVPLPVVEWFKDGEPIRPGGRFKVIREGYANAIEIPSVGMDDEGRLTVTARNSQGEHSCTVSINVYPGSDDDEYSRTEYFETETTEVQQQDFRRVLKRHVEIRRKPEFSREFMDKQVREGDPVTFECVLSGQPEPEIVWTVDDNRIRESPDSRMSYDGEVARLQLRHAKAHDEGEYKCTAINVAGETSCAAELSVRDAEDDEHMRKQGGGLSAAKIEKGPGNVTIRRGKKVTIKVRFAGDPIPEVKWFKGDEELCPGGRITIETHNNLTKLTIRDVRPEDTGKYTLSVENSRGADTCSTCLTVEDVPEAPSGKPEVEEVTANSAVLSWDAPNFDGGSPITGYTIEMCKAKDKRWKVVKEGINSLSYEVRRLQPQTKYMFRVRAQNVHGASEPSKPSDPVATLEGEEEWPFEPQTVLIQEDTHIKDKYEIKEEIAKGRFSTVYKCVDKTTNREYACKLVNAVKKSSRQAVRDEVDIMNQLHHPMLLQANDAFSKGKDMAIVTELVPGGELLERITSPNYILTERDCIIFMRQLCEAVQYMHDQDILHLDLKPENVLCVNDNSNQIKLIDFNLSRPHKPGDTTKVMFGTPEFVAPEVINYEPVDKATDMWSVGVIAYTLLSGLSPFAGETDQETLENVTKGEWDFDDEAFSNISEEGKDFITHLIEKAQRKRMSAEECIGHPWLAQDPNRVKGTTIDTDKHKRLLVQRKWQEKQLLQKPEFVEKMENTTVTEGNRAIFTVKLGGIPEPSVEFFRDGELIEEGGRHQFLYSEDGTCALVLNRVTSADEDQYECTISNSLGEATCVAELIVEGADGKRKTRGDGRRKKLEPSEGPLMPTGPLRVTVLTHDSIEVDWQPPVFRKGAEPSHYVIEYRNLTLNEEPKFLKLKADQTYTVFEDLIENHKYFVGVAAENVYGVSDPLEVVVVIGQIGQREPDASFTKPLEDLEVVRGQDAKFSCEVDKLSGAIKWLQDGVPIKPSSKFEMSTDEEKKTITLVIKEADFDDEAVYTCMCGRKQCVADLLVNEPPPSFTKELEDKEVMESNPVTFECIVDQDNLKNVKWLKDGRRIQTGERIRTKIDRNKLTLTIKEACLDDQGTYTCKLEGNKSAAKLSVKSEPGFSSQLRDVEVMEKESIELVCEVAHKDMEVKWLKNQRPLRPGGRIEVSEDGCRRKLFIREASLDDNGTYFCQTGNKQTACIVNVEEAPAAEFIRKLEDVSCGEHDTVTLSCEVSFDDADVTWLKDGKPIRESGEKYEIVKNGTLRKLVINDVVREDKGRYVCQAGDNRTKADVTVEIPPRVFVDKRFEEVTVSADELLSLELGYEGYPPCTVTWILEEQEITETRRIRVVTSEKKSQLVVKPVQGKDAGNYKCIVENEHGQETVPFRVNVIDKPGPPQDLKVTEVTHDSITLTWDEPKDSGGDEIKGYLIERRDTKRQSFQVAGRTQDTTFTITDLIEGNKYKCRVTAENRQGQGEPAETMGAIEVKDQFTEPTAPKGKPIVSNITPDSCKVTWEPPEDNGGSPITGYVLEKKTSFSPRWNKVTREPIKEPTFTIDGLIEDQEYEFRVAAVNKAGAGPPGPASDVIVARECNEPPKALLGKNLKNGMNVKVGDDLKITVPFSGMPPPEVSWTCGDTPLVNDDRVKIETIGDTAVLTVKDAQKEDTGSYGIKLGNEFGEDSASIPVNVIDKPAAPTDIKVVDISADKATLEWGAPDDAGGADIIDYVVEVMEEDEEIWRKVTKTKTTHTVVEKLKEGNKYKFRVHSENDAGASEAVETDEAVEAVDKPAPPHALLDDKHKKIYINAGETLVLTVPFTGTPPPEVAWFIGDELSESNNRSHVDVMKGKTILNVAGTKPTDAGEYRLKLSNDEGEEESLFSVTVLDKPHCPVQPEVTDVKKDNITIAWEKPEHDGGSPITGYIVEKRDTRDNRWETVATNVTETEWTIPQLKEGHSYSFSVSAVNAIGASAPVETAEATKATRQPEPAKLNLDEALLRDGIKVKGGDTIKIEVPFSGCPTPDVKFTKNGEPLGRRAKVTVDEDKAILEIPRADRDDAGSYGVEIKNDLGEDSAEIPVTIIDKPKSPQNLTVPETTVDTVTLAWEPPADDGGSPITGYRIERRDARRQMWTDAGTATECTYTVPGLIEGNRYHFRVSAQSKAGNSEPLETSQPITAKNMFDEPEPPAAPEVSNITPESCIINWKPPEKDAGIPVTGYHLEKRTGYSPRWMKVSREPITDTSYRLDELVEGEEYEFRVAAENRMGTGRFSRPSERIVAKDHKTPAALKLSDQMKEGITVKKGETMNFEVPFDGSPVPEIAWLMNEEPLPDSVVVSNTGTKSIISIDDVSMNDSGEYKIQIVNEHGADEAIIPVKVIDTPTAPNDVRVANITSEDAVVEWDSPDEDGGAEILGFQIEICDEETPDKWKKVASTKAKRVTVTDLKEDHEYKFRVSAENAAGCSKPAETEQPVLAQDKPSAPSLRIGDKYNDGIKVKAGQPVKLDIPFRSNPPAEVTWEFNGQPLEEGGKIKVDTTKNNSSVVVKDSKRADKGEYKITVKNDLGEDSFTVPVEVIDKPAAPKEVRMKDVTAKEATVAWDAPEDDGGAEIRDFIVEICDMDEAPDRWRQVAKNNDGLASLHNLKEDHEYKVRVIAENAMGKGEPKEAEKPFVAQDKPMAPSLHVGNTYDKDNCKGRTTYQT